MLRTVLNGKDAGVTILSFREVENLISGIKINKTNF